MLEQLVARLRKAVTEEELMAIVREAAEDSVLQNRIIDMLTLAQLEAVSAALLASAKEQFGADFAHFIKSYVPVTIAFQRALAKTDLSVPDPALRRHLMGLLDD